MSMNKRSALILAAIAVLFLALRLPGVGLTYYQDEWKNVSAAATVEGAGQFFAHPPLMQMLFVADHAIFGEGGFRILPLLISLASLFLLYAVARRRIGEQGAVWASILYALSFYGILGSLQPDVDGSVLPLLFLAAAYAYDRVRDLTASPSVPRAWVGDVPDRRAKWWMAAFAAALLVGLLTKLSFILAVGAFILDFLWEYRRDRFAARVGLAAAFGAVLVAMFVALLYLIQAVYPAFSISFMLAHANQFRGDGGRQWMQIAVQAIKAVYYLSPLLIAPLVLMTRDIVRKTRPFWIYLGLGFLFYFVIFDFSQGALDKYLMYSLAPLTIAGGAIFAEALRGWRERMSPKGAALAKAAGIVLAIALVALNRIPHAVAALYPKSEWFGRVLHLHWNVLTPINGGSGPMGFYVSFLFIALSFIAAILIAVAARAKKGFAPAALVLILSIGVAYNLVFAEEYLFGRMNGSAAGALAQATAFIASKPQIAQVLTYNDIGARELAEMGKYAGRFYAAPQFDDSNAARFANFKGYYMIVDIPHIYEDSFFGRYFASCTALWSGASGRIGTGVYDCSRATAPAGR